MVFKGCNWHEFNIEKDYSLYSFLDNYVEVEETVVKREWQLLFESLACLFPEIVHEDFTS